MHSLVQEYPHCQERIRPFVGGTEINSRPDQGTDRHVIGFGRMTLEDAEARWPHLVAILREKVKPDRESRPKNEQSLALAKRWWQWHTDRPTLQAASAGMERVIVGSAVTAHFCFAFQSTSRVFSHSLNVFALIRTRLSPHCIVDSMKHGSGSSRRRSKIGCVTQSPIPWKLFLSPKDGVLIVILSGWTKL